MVPHSWCTVIPPSLGLRTGSSSSSTNAESESDIMPPLEEVTSGSGSSEEESDRSEGEEDWQSTGEEGGNLGRATVNSEGFGDETWELFSLSGVRHNSV
jgi:hypothetical protein